LNIVKVESYFKIVVKWVLCLIGKFSLILMRSRHCNEECVNVCHWIFCLGRLDGMMILARRPACFMYRRFIYGR
jgi:hypothetical protein